MNKKQKTLRLKKINAQNKLYKKTGYWSYKELGYASLHASQKRDEE
tara:strand:+ start:51 stop:188 length:138 start_codon:yes stop_codon:yes gene_type:complete